MTSPFIPCSFTYGDAPQGGQVMPMIIASRDPSNTTDLNYAPGYLWLSDITQGGSGNLWVQGGFTSGIPAWTVITAGGLGALNTLSDGATQVAPVGGNIALVSGNANQIVVTSSAPAHELVFSLPALLIAPGSVQVTTALSVGTTLTVTGDASFGDDVTIADDLTVTGDLIVSGAIVLAGLTVAGTVDLNVTGNAATNIGNGSGSGLIFIDVPSGDLTIDGNGNDILIGQDAAANHIVIGSTTGAAGTIIKAGTDNLLLTGAVTTSITIGDVAQTGDINLGLSTAGQDINIGSADNASAQTIDIGNGNSGANSIVRILSGTGTAGAGTLLLGNNTRVTVASLADVAPAASRTVTVGGGTITTAVTDTIDIGPDGATTNAGATKTVNVNTGGVTLGSVLTNIATGTVTSGTHTTAIATGNRAAGTMKVDLLTGTGTKTFNVGNADGGTTTTFLGPHNINASQNNNTNINTGTSTGTVAIGNSLATAATIDAVAISLDATDNSNFTVTGANKTLTLASALGKVLVSSTINAAQAIYLHANGGVTETIQLHADQGIAVNSINILSDVGGITLTATGLASADAINLEAPAGGIDMDSALEFNIASSQAAATAVNIIASNAAGGVTVQTGAGGNLTLGHTTTTGNIVLGDIQTSGTLTIGSTAAGTGLVRIVDGTGNQTVQIATGAAVKTVSLGSTNTTSATTINSGSGNLTLVGNVLKTTSPAFLSYLGATVNNKTGAGTAYTLGTDALTEVFDRGSNASTAGVFTAPVTGLYWLKSQVTLTGCTIATTFVISIVATSRTAIYTFIKAAGSQDESVSVDSLFDMTATDTAHVTIAVTGEGGDTVDILGAASLQTYFTGYLVA